MKYLKVILMTTVAVITFGSVQAQVRVSVGDNHRNHRQVVVVRHHHHRHHDRRVIVEHDRH
jgi:hypothetical protein